jgi:predicted RNA-binding protein (virulence factor B family)
MIEIGHYNNLEILRETTVGLFLGDEDGEDVLLPNKYVPEEYEIGDMLEVFVYLDYDERKVATNLTPLIHLHEFALLEAAIVDDVGAFMDWGLEKQLLVPYKEQRQKLQEGRWYIIYLDIDKKTNRLYGSNKIEKRLDNEELTVGRGEEVEIIVYRETPIGYSVIVNHMHKGLIYKNEVNKELRIGEKRQAYVKMIRDDNKLDISITPIGYQNVNSSNSSLIFTALKSNDGYLEINDKSSPDQIKALFGLSKKAFKKAVGELYRERKIILEEKGIRLTPWAKSGSKKK